MRKIAIAVLSLFFLLSLIALAVQSTWGKEKAVSLLTEAMKSQGITVQVDEIQGSLPHELLLNGVRLTSKGLTLTFGSLEVRLSLLRLLKREIAFSLIKGDRVTWEKTEEPLIFDKTGLPFLLNVEKFQFTNVAIPDRFLAQFEGHLRIGKKNRYAVFDITALRPDYPDAKARLLFSIQRNGSAFARLHFKTPSLDALPFEIPIEGTLALNATGRGHWSSFLTSEGKIQGTVKGTFHPTSIPLLLGDWLEREWTFSGRFLRHEDQSWSLPRMSGRSDFFNFKGHGALDPSGKITAAQLQIQSDHLELAKPLPFSGRLFANVHLREEGDALFAKATWRIPRLGVGEYFATGVMGNVEGNFEKGTLKGSASLTGDYLAQKWEAKADYQWAKGSSWNFTSYRIATDALEFKGALEVRPDALLIGTTELTADQIHPLAESLYGKGTGKALWYLIEQDGALIQAVQCDGKASGFYCGTLSAEEISLYSDVIEPFQKFDGTFYLEMEKAKWRTLSLDAVSLETSTQGENWPFKLLIDGEWKHPLTLQLDGYWRTQGEEVLISLQSGTGSFYNHPFTLVTPLNVEWSPSLFRMQDLTVQFADATLSAGIEREGNSTEAHLTAKHLPLDFLSLNPLDVAVSGFFDGNAAVKEREDRLEGNFDLAVEQMEVATLGQREPLDASGNFEGSFSRDRLAFKGELMVHQAPLFNLDLSLPIHLEIWPFKAELLNDQSAKMHFALKGKIEDFLDFADLGTHQLEGDCNCDLTLSRTLAHPLLEGYCNFENAYYQNYYTGTELKNIHAEWIAKQDTLYLRSLTAQDLPGKGSLKASGEIRFHLKERFPYRFQTEFSRFNFLTLDFITAEAEGKLILTGNQDKGLATGAVQILKTDVSIPERVPRRLPDLQVVYKNASKPPEPPQSEPKEPYPLFLDLNIDAPDGIFISGRGLNSEWKGAFHVGGTQTAIQAKGQIELIKGEFLFAARHFKLTDGALIFSGIENEMPFLNLAGTMDVKDVSIVARLKGPLNNPQITLQSSPPLPMGTIMSYLLFGQEMSEINSFQALQLANSLASLAGEGPGVLEATRRSLGIDRLQIISVPGAVEGEETIAVQVGKYVTEDVLVSISQGAEDAGTHISIEVELKGGLSFVLESQQVQEQGKFTLRWTKTY